MVRARLMMRIGVALLLTGAFSGQTHAQSREYNEYSTIPCYGEYLQLMGGIGWSVPVKNFSDEMALGLNTSISGSCSFAATTSNAAPELLVGLTTPVYATLKYGAGSSKHSDAAVGFGLGIGGCYNIFLASITSQNPSDDSFTGYFRPAVMAEIALDLGASSSFLDNSKLVFQHQPGSYEKSHNLMDYGINKDLDYGYIFQPATIVSYVFFLDYK